MLLEQGTTAQAIRGVQGIGAVSGACGEQGLGNQDTLRFGEAKQSLPFKGFLCMAPVVLAPAEDSVLGVASEMDIIEELGAQLTGLTDQILDVKLNSEISNKG